MEKNLGKIIKLNKWFYLPPFALYFFSISPLKEIFIFLAYLLVMLWLYAVSICGQIQLQKENITGHNIKSFKRIFLRVPLLVLFNIFFGGKLLDFETIGVSLFTLLVLLTIFSVFYLYYFVAWTITSLEKKRPVKLMECQNNFFLIGLLGLGVFFLQTKIQRLLYPELN